MVAIASVELSLIDSNSDDTRVGAVLGTPAYMSPEQAAGDVDQLGASSDVYSLGATFYYLLTGRRPISGRSVEQVLDRVKRGEVVSPRSVDRKVARQLDAICMKAMATIPEDRYQSAGKMKQDIDQFLADEIGLSPTRIRPLPRWPVGEKPSRRGSRGHGCHPRQCICLRCCGIVGKPRTHQGQ